MLLWLELLKIDVTVMCGCNFWGRSQKRRGVAKVICIMISQEGFNVDIDGRAGHCKLKTTDDIRVKDPEVSNAFAMWKDLSTAAGEEGGVCKKDDEN